MPDRNFSKIRFIELTAGAAGDEPMAGDYDGDGKTEYAVFRPAEGVWYVLGSSNKAFTARQFGVIGDLPIPAASIR